ncbi:hypothetical protein D3C78_837720 [compost metagenome]
MHEDPERPGKRADNGPSIARQGLQQQNVFLPMPPTIHQGFKHAHGLDDFGVAQVLRGVERGADMLLVGLGQWWPRQLLIDNGKH